MFFSCEYYEIFKKSYFEEHLPTAASGLNEKHDSYYDVFKIQFNRLSTGSIYYKKQKVLRQEETDLFVLAKYKTRNLTIVPITMYSVNS